MLHYTATDVDDLAADDFLMLVGLLEQQQKAQAAEAAELARMEAGT